MFWLLIIAAAVTAYFITPNSFAPVQIAEFLRRFERAALIAYFFLSSIRGLTLLPSTPLVLAGVMLFPESPWAVLTISLIGIVISSTLIYWLSEWLGIAQYFEERKPRHIERIRTRLEHPTGLFFVVLWAFFPLVPTDAVCYVAGSIRMNFLKFIAAIFVGEVFLCSLYIFGAGHLIKKFMGMY